LGRVRTIDREAGARP